MDSLIYNQFLLIYNVAEMRTGINHVHIHTNKNPLGYLYVFVDNWGVECRRAGVWKGEVAGGWETTGKVRSTWELDCWEIGANLYCFSF